MRLNKLLSTRMGVPLRGPVSDETRLPRAVRVSRVLEEVVATMYRYLSL
jgi:hypothetical protein